MATCSDKPMSSDKPPKLRDLFSLWLNDWYKVGEKLHVDKATLNRLQKSYCDNIPECKKRMFGVWLRNHQNPSYEVVMQALLEADESRAAEELHQKHGISLSKLLQSRETESYKLLSQVSLVLSGPDQKTKQSVRNVVSEYIKERENTGIIEWRMKMDKIIPYLRKNEWFDDAVQECVNDDFPPISRYCYIDLGELLEVNEVGPLLLNVKSTQFVCLDARENLAKPVQQGKETATTFGDIVHQALHTVGNMIGQVSQRVFGSVVVGTFSANDSEEKVASVNSALKSSLEECGCCQEKEIKYRHFKKGNLIFPLAKGSPEHDEHIKSFIRQVDRYHGWRVNIKSSVYKFFCLCYNRGGILKISECESFMKVCGISSNEFPRILRSIHYHSGLILHYADIPSLKDLVICHPQIVIDGLIHLITDINRFENNAHITGEIPEATLKNACFIEEESLSNFQIISLLQYYHISSQIQRNVYFLPFLLPFDPSVNQASKATSAILKMLYPVPIAIHFLNSQVPAGIFYALVCQLSKSWKLADEHRYKNRITFLIESGISCTLLNHEAFVEVRVNGASRLTPLVLFRYIIQEISEILSYVKGFFKHTENLEFKIDCFCPNSTNHSLHIAEFNKEDPSQIKCENLLCQGQVIPVEENYAAWFSFENEEGSVLFGRSASWQAARGENEEVLELIQEHIEQEGSVKLRIVKSLFFGPPSVGKTTTRKRMTGEIDNLSTSAPPTSTGIDNPITVSLYHESAVLITDSVDQWKEQNIESQADMLINHLLQAGKHPSNPTTPTASPYISRSNSSHKLQQRHLELMETSVETTSHVSSPRSFNPQDTLQQERKSSLSSVRFSSLASQSMGGPSLHSEPVALPFITRMVQERRWKELKELFQNIQDYTLLQMIDIGGQPEFQEILPLLLSGPALYLTFINLTQELDNTYEVTYTQQDHSRSPITYRSHYTIKEILLQIYTTIASMNSGNQRSTAFLLGTYRDQVTTESIANLENQVSTSSLNDFIKRGILYRALPHLGRCIYPLDNMSGDREEIKILQSQLATHIQTKFQPQSLPTSWVFFHLALRNLYENTAGFCSLEDAIKVGSTYGISRENVSKVLSFIHRQFGTILFYPEITSLAELVICNPNVIFKPMSNLIAAAFGENINEPDLVAEIRRSGQFHPDFLERVMTQFDDSVIHNAAIVDLMKHRSIISEVCTPHGNVVYFMPSLLPPDANVSQETNENIEILEPSPLLLRFPEGYIPIGLSSSLIVQLSKQWMLQEHKQQYKNRFSLIADRQTLSEIEIIQRSSVLEVRVDCDGILETRKVCMNALKLIDQAIKEIKSSHEYMRNTRHEFGFYCPQSLQGNEKPHFAACLDIEKPENMLCTSKCPKQRIPLLQKHKIWFPGHEDPVEEMELGSPQDLPPPKNYRQEVETMIKENQISTDKIDRDNESSQLMIDLPRELHTIWFPLGCSLDVHLTELNIISKDHPNDCQGSFMAMLNAWLKTGRASWLSLVQSLNRESLGNYSEIAYNVAMNHRCS